MTRAPTSEPSPSPSERRRALGEAFARCRAGTVALYEDLEEAEYRRQPHPDFSPPGWHLGHIAYTEALWLVNRAGGRALPFPELERTFSVTGLPKPERSNIPPFDEVADYAAAVREETEDCLSAAALEMEDRLWRFVLQHEGQHGETVTFLKQYLRRDRLPAAEPAGARPAAGDDMIEVPAGPVSIGADGPEAMDNERRPHEVVVGDYRIGRHPVTQRRYADFLAAGGYDEPRWWTAEGWAWRRREGAEAPLYWRRGADDHPVAGVSAHEAEAYCRFRGLRLPTEAEWEKAAAWDPAAGHRRRYPWGEAAPGPGHCNHDGLAGGTTPVAAHPAGRSAYGGEGFLGNVWEWTASVFAPYPEFERYPYDGYSEIYFDGRHRVLRGGSWATRPWVLRAAFRNFYLPETRQLLAGFRVAADGLAG